MSLLEKKNWPLSLILLLFAPDVYIFLLSYFSGCMDDNAWYAKWQYWVIGTICLIFPVFIMLAIFELQMLVKLCQKLKVAGEEIYGNVYIWILCIIIPVVGWIFITVMYIYLKVFSIVKLAQGNGEAYIK